MNSTFAGADYFEAGSLTIKRSHASLLQRASAMLAASFGADAWKEQGRADTKVTAITSTSLLQERRSKFLMSYVEELKKTESFSSLLYKNNGEEQLDVLVILKDSSVEAMSAAAECEAGVLEQFDVPVNVHYSTEEFLPFESGFADFKAV